jgi:putative ABC transport system permease protein
MNLLRVAFRNVFRNRRRSMITMAAILIGTVAVLLVGAMISFITLDFQSAVIRRNGHLTVYKNGYFEFGAGNSAAYGIADYEAVLAVVRNDPVLRPLTRLATPVQEVLGLAGNYQANRSKPFFGEGIVPKDHVEMARWDDFGLHTAGSPKAELPADPQSGVLGFGLGRILGLCEPLHIPNCHAAPAEDPVKATSGTAEPQIQSITALQEQDAGEGRDATRDSPHRPRIDLLAATAGGAPNVVSLNVDHAEFQGSKTVDDNFAMMHLELAQQLVYGRGEHKVTAIVLQLHHSASMPVARARLQQIFAAHGLPLEVRDFAELTPLYPQVLAFFAFLFSFVVIVLATIVLFTVVNTMSMVVMERVDEIGTVRALGLQRSSIRWQFLLEGCLLGALGATAGVAVACGIALGVNSSELTWSPPTAGGQVPLKLLISGTLAAGTWLVLVLLASVASLLPANRAARMNIVDALRHV